MINNIRTYIQHHGAWALIVVCAIFGSCGGLFAPMAPLYMPIFIVASLVIIISGITSINITMILLLGACACSIFFASPSEIFQPWFRLCYMILIWIVLSPMFSSRKLNIFRQHIFEWIMCFCIFVGVGSFLGYFLGINYMRPDAEALITRAGLFGGLVYQSMTLGPLAGLGLAYLVWLHFVNKKSSNLNTYMRWCMMLSCLGSVLLSASRSALLSTMGAIAWLVFVFLRHQPKKMFQILLSIIFLSFCLLPFIQHFGKNTLAKQQANQNAGSSFSSRSHLWEDRKQEFISSPVYGVGFASQKIVSYQSSLKTGIIEPGTSYGTIFAMTGLLGGIPFLFILFGNLLKRSGHSPGSPPVSPAQAALALFSIHMIAEGYVFAAGSGLSAVFWASIGGAYAYRNLTNERT